METMFGDIKTIGAGITMGLGALGPALSIGILAAKAMESIGTVSYTHLTLPTKA